jgi:lysozyme
MLQITPQIYLLLKAVEGFKPQAYFDSAGIPTIGFGTIRYSNGDPVHIGDEITEDMAEIELFTYVREKVEPTMNKHFPGVQLQPNQRDALGSFIYNLGGNAGKYPTLKGLINDGATDEAICDQWMKYHNAGGKPSLGLYRRRMAEVLLWLGFDWDDAYSTAWESDIGDDWRDYADWEDEQEDLFEALAIPHPREVIDATQDPTPDTPLTMDDLQYQGAVSAGYDGSFGDFTAHRTVVRQKDVVSVPNVDMSKPPKRMEDSKTHKGLSKAESGKEGVQVGAVVTGGATVLAAVEGGTSTAERTLNAADRANDLVFGLSSGDLITVGIVIGLPLILWGGWRWWAGKMIAYEGRQEGDQAKV